MYRENGLIVAMSLAKDKLKGSGGVPSLFASTIQDTDKIGNRRFSSTDRYVQKDIELGAVIGKDLKAKLRKQIPDRFDSLKSPSQITRVGIGGKRQLASGRKKGGLDIFALMDSAMETGPTEEAKQRAREEAATKKAIEAEPLPPKQQKVVKTKPISSGPGAKESVPSLFASTVGKPNTGKEPAWKMRIKSVETSIDVTKDAGKVPELDEEVKYPSPKEAVSRSTSENRSPQKAENTRLSSIAPKASSDVPVSFASPITSRSPKNKVPLWKLRLRDAQTSLASSNADRKSTDSVTVPVEEFRKEAVKSMADIGNDDKTEEDDSSVSVSDVETVEDEVVQPKLVVKQHTLSLPSKTNNEPAWKIRLREAQGALESNIEQKTEEDDYSVSVSGVQSDEDEVKHLQPLVDKSKSDDDGRKQYSALSISNVEEEGDEVVQTKHVAGHKSLTRPSAKQHAAKNKEPAWKMRLREAQLALANDNEQKTVEEDSSVSVSDLEPEEDEPEQPNPIIVARKETLSNISPENKEPAWKARLRDVQQSFATSAHDDTSTSPISSSKNEESNSLSGIAGNVHVLAPETKSPVAMDKAKRQPTLKDLSHQVSKSKPAVPSQQTTAFVPKASSQLSSSTRSTSDPVRNEPPISVVPESTKPQGSALAEISRRKKLTDPASEDSNEEEDNYPSAFKFTATPRTPVSRDLESDSDTDSDSDDDIRGAFNLSGRLEADDLPSAEIDFSVDDDKETMKFIFALEDALVTAKPIEWYQEQIKETEKRLAASMTNHKLQKADLKKLVDRRKESLTDVYEGRMEARVRMGAKLDKTFQKAYEDEQKIVESLRKENKRVRGEVNKLPRQINETKNSIVSIEAANKEIEEHLESLGKFAKKLERDHEKLQASSTKCRDEYLPRYRNELRSREAHIDIETSIKNLYRNCILKISRHVKKPELQEAINEMILETEADVNPKFDPAVLFDSESDSDDSDSDSDSTSSSSSSD